MSEGVRGSQEVREMALRRDSESKVALCRGDTQDVFSLSSAGADKEPSLCYMLSTPKEHILARAAFSASSP